MSPTATTQRAKAQSNGSATITASQAKQLLAAEQTVERRRAQLEQAEQKRDQVRERVRDRIPLSTRPEDKRKRIRFCIAGGIKIRVTPTKGGDRFSLKRYCEAGHTVTTEMQEAITPSPTYDRWTVKAKAE